MGGLQGGDWGRGRSPPRPLFAVSNVIARPSTASVPITVLLYNGPLLCDFNVRIKGLTNIHNKQQERDMSQSTYYLAESVS